MTSPPGSSPAPRGLRPAPSIFGTQRPASTIAGVALLLAGFSGLAVAFWIFTANWAGVLLPLGFLIGAINSLRTDVREIELRGDTLLVRTFFREYPIPRAHVTKILRTESGAAVQVLNGNRYAVTPPDADANAVASALETWLTGN